MWAIKVFPKNSSVHCSWAFQSNFYSSPWVVGPSSTHAKLTSSKKCCRQSRTHDLQYAHPKQCHHAKTLRLPQHRHATSLILRKLWSRQKLFIVREIELKTPPIFWDGQPTRLLYECWNVSPRYLGVIPTRLYTLQITWNISKSRTNKEVDYMRNKQGKRG